LTDNYVSGMLNSKFEIEMQETKYAGIVFK